MVPGDWDLEGGWELWGRVWVLVCAGGRGILICSLLCSLACRGKFRCSLRTSNIAQGWDGLLCSLIFPMCSIWCPLGILVCWVCRCTSWIFGWSCAFILTGLVRVACGCPGGLLLLWIMSYVCILMAIIIVTRVFN